MTKPLIVVNFKAYGEVCGEAGLGLARACEEIGKETGTSIVSCPQMVDLALVAQSIRAPVWSQSSDAVSPGGRTGHTTVKAIKGAGATGTLVNHSESRKLLFDIEDIVKRCREEGIVSCVCTNNIRTSIAAAALGPDFVAVEPPELIGGDVSVTSADPEIVSNAVEGVKAIDRKVNVLCGAGVKNSADVAKAIELGARGVLLASGVVKAKDPRSVLRDLASAL